jgi:hypothetical protein
MINGEGLADSRLLVRMEGMSSGLVYDDWEGGFVSRLECGLMFRVWGCLVGWDGRIVGAVGVGKGEAGEWKVV